jgi:hypothetical protein
MVPLLSLKLLAPFSTVNSKTHLQALTNHGAEPGAVT